MLSLRFPLHTTQHKHKPSLHKSKLPRKSSLQIPSVSVPDSHLFSSSSSFSYSIEDEERRETDARSSMEEDGVLRLPEGLRREFLPKHVAVIMDGNVRWARKKGYPPSLGHEAGVRSLREVVRVCGNLGIRVLTVFAFSYDNWNRPKMEIDFLMSLFERGIQSEIDNFIREGIKVSFIGDSSKLPESLQRMISRMEKSTKSNSELQLIVAASYSGQYDIVQACRRLAEKVKEGLILPADINETLIEQELETNCTDFPYPDLLIRTSGELRVSNFLLWQLAYTELFFAPSLWPDFGEAEFIGALLSFQQRRRRYGKRD